MTSASGSSSDGRSLDDVKRQQMDRLDEMQKLDGDVIGLNSAYIDILDRITNKLDLLATLADEIESDTRLHPDSMDDILKTRFDLLSQSALMNRYMCSKALFQNAIGALQAMNQFGSDYLNANVTAPTDASTCESTEINAQGRHSDVSGDTIASDSDATVAARLDDSHHSQLDDDEGATAGPSHSIPAQSIDSPSTLQLKKEEQERDDLKGDERQEDGNEVIQGGMHNQDEVMIEVANAEDAPRDPSEEARMVSSAISERPDEYGRDCDGRVSVAGSIRSVESLENVGEKKRRKKKRKRSKSSDKKRRSREAEKMENILNKHLKRSRDKQMKKWKDEGEPQLKEEGEQPDVNQNSVSKEDIEVVTISDDDSIVRPVKMSRVDDYEDIEMVLESRDITVPTTTPLEDYENYRREVEKMGDIKREEKGTFTPASTQVLASVVHPLNVPSVPLPVPPPILPISLGRGPRFIAAPMQEAPCQETPSKWSILNEERPVSADPGLFSLDLLCDEKKERAETACGDAMEKIEDKRGKESRGSLKERLAEEIRLRECGKYSPERRGRSRSLSYSPRRDRSWSRERSRSNSRDRERRDWRRGSRIGFRYAYRQRYQRWSRSPTRSRSRSRVRSYSRDREESRYRSSRSRSVSRSRKNRSKSRSRSWSRSRSTSRRRSLSRDRSNTPISPDEREVNSPIPRAYARFRNRSSERNGKKKEDKKDETERGNDILMAEAKFPSSSVEETNERGTTPSHGSWMIVAPPPAPPSLVESPSSRAHSGSSSPCVFVPPPPIVVPPKPPPLKISIPSTLPSTARSPPSSATSQSKHREREKREINDNRSSSSDMSVEGNTVSEGSNGNKSTKNGEDLVLDIPTPPLSNPSAMEQRKLSHGDECIPPPPPPPALPPLPPLTQSIPSITETNARRAPSPTVSINTCGTSQSLVGGSRSSGRLVNGPYPLHSFQPHQFYSNGTPSHNPYGPQNAWLNQEAQWQQYYHHYNQDPLMMGVYNSPSVPLHPSPVAPVALPEAHGSFIKAMRVIPTPITQPPPPDWAQMAREHANQQINLANPLPPQPLLGQQIHLMGHHSYGTPQSGRGGSRFRGGGNGRRW